MNLVFRQFIDPMNNVCLLMEIDSCDWVLLPIRRTCLAGEWLDLLPQLSHMIKYGTHQRADNSKKLNHNFYRAKEMLWSVH